MLRLGTAARWLVRELSPMTAGGAAMPGTACGGVAGKIGAGPVGVAGL